MICIVAVLSIIAILYPLHLVDRPLAAALNLFLIVVLLAAVGWGARYAILLSFLAAFAFGWLIPPLGHFHINDSRAWTVLAACLVTGITASHLSGRLKRAVLEAQDRRAEAVAEQQRFRDLVNSIEGIVWAADAQTLKFSFVSQQAERVLGYPTERWLNEPAFWKDHLHPDDQAYAVQLSQMRKHDDECEYRMIAADGRVVWMRNLVTVVAEDGHPTRLRGVMVDITERKQAEEERKRAEEALLTAMAERTRLAGFREAIGTALAREQDLRRILHDCTEAMVRHLDAAFARIWTLGSDGRELELQASAGIYARLDGSHSRIPLGHLKVGLIAAERKPHLTNDVQNDPRVKDKEWARREKMVSFAGYPLLVGDRVVGVMAMFSSQALSESTLETLSVVADTIAQGIDRKHAQEALWLNEAYLAESQRLTHTGSFAWDLATREALHLSDEWYRIYGFDPGDKLSWQQRVQRIHPEDRSRWEAAINQAIKEKSDYDVEYRIDLPDGATKHLHTVGHPVLNDSGDVVQFMGTSTDITERKRAEEELRAAETRFRTYVDHATDALFVRYDRGYIADVNRQACDSLGYTREELIGMSPSEFDVDTAPAFYETMRDRLKAGEILTFETSHRRKDGTVFPVEVRIRRFWDGSRPFTLALARDISDRKRADEEREKLRLLEAELAHINRVTTMGELTASLAHEINQPIAAAMTNANTCVRWLTRDVPDINEARAAAGRLVKDTQRAGEIISRIRLLFKKGAPQRELVDINGVINEIVALLRNEAARQGVLIRNQLAANLPQVMGDRIQLQQVLMNLMINSIDAMKDVGGARELTLTSQRDGNDQVQVSVTDTGIGLPPEMGRIFEAFYTTKPHGTGMGLAISRTIIESHGGRMWATTNSGHGAIFYFTLPANVEAAQ